MAKRIFMTRFLKGGYHVCSDGSGLMYEDTHYKLKIVFVKDYVYIIPVGLEDLRKRVEEFNPQNAQDIFDKIKEIKQITGQTEVRIVINEEIFG